MTVITGVSGSGKSSLAFDTLYAEGQRQYIDSLSAYARQFLDQIPRPDVDSIDGLAPTLAIDQKPGSTGVRSTVATVTEIYDYLRLLYARVGTPHCGKCGSEISQQSSEAIRDSLAALPEGTKLVLMAPMVRGRRGSHREVIESIRKAGLIRARIDGETYLLEEVPELAPRKNHTIEAVVDRLAIREGIESRLSESVRLSLRLGNGLLSASFQNREGDWVESIFSTAMACIECGSSFAEIEPRTFSFNSPYGACPGCDGLGRIGKDEQLRVCDQCGGGRLCAEALRVTIAQLPIQQFTAMPLSEASAWINALPRHLSGMNAKVAEPIVAEVGKRLAFLQRVGVGYLTLDRSADSLSGGELQRVRLATSIGSGLVGVCYVLDEPSIGLHAADHSRLIECIGELRAQGNTVVVVEHDEATMWAADVLVDVGPGAGPQGGKIISRGTPQAVAADRKSLTGAYLSGRASVPIPPRRRPPDSDSRLSLLEVTTHNLKSIDVDFPLGLLIGISGVSGSGKSSLVNDTLYPVLASSLGLVSKPAGSHRELRRRQDRQAGSDRPIADRSQPAQLSGYLRRGAG